MDILHSGVQFMPGWDFLSNCDRISHILGKSRRA